ncbi:FCS-Like Zinc finger 6 [Cajanus cajan]|uniref:FLZ-type domain-containing protein n=1 Tax=Cajanus cajan TaxID=3821 RepID=A0A151SDJ6_CAJCA|nr:FCS-Like Zinc finger 6 [Cajanus cajan]KYP52853.1 hypothetical protein KK1_025239 [Cajanus cajan]
MMLGKRPPPPQVKRTTSMSDITFDLNNPAVGADGPGPSPGPWSQHPPDGLDQSRVWATVSPRKQRDLAHTHPPDFLRACFLCKGRLVAGRDIYMYRGDSAFCSSECREKQMKQDERKEKCGVGVPSKPQTLLAL